MFKQILVTLSLALLLSACGKDDDFAPGAAAPNNLQGTYRACGDNGDGTSTEITLIFDGNNRLAETLNGYATVIDCSGLPDNTLLLAATYQFETFGQSQFEAGATNVTLTPDDNFGCGLGVPVYTYLKLAGDMNSFTASGNQPSCDPNNRGTGLKLQFYKQ